MKSDAVTPPLLRLSADDMLHAFREIADAWPQVIWMNVAATGQQLYVNPAWSEVTGQTAATAYADPLSWQRNVHEDDIERVGAEYGAWAASGFAEPLQLQMRYRYADGSVRWVLCIACATRPDADSEQVIVGIAIDNTETEEFIQEALQAAHSDALTGLRNRRGFLPELAEALRDRRGTSTALLLVDLDGFKAVNDLYGHAEGDRLLQRVSDAIRSTIRASDLAFRLGGDEFAVVQRDTSGRDCVTTAERIVEAIRRIEPRDPAIAYDVAASCGIALSTPEHPLTAEIASSQADAALYAAKTFARGGSFVFPGDSPSEAAHMMKQPTWGKRLHEAFYHDEFRLLAQPVVSLDDGAITGFELLLRLDDIAAGADELVLHIYRLGRKRQLDWWVVDRAARIATEQAEALEGRTLGINISIVSLSDPSFTEHVHEAFAHVPNADRRFVFEITERDAIDEPDVARESAEALRDLGVTLVLDDFGTGYGSPELLRSLPFGGLKLDRHFVAASGSSSIDNLIARHSADLARALHIGSVAEGIESEDVAIGMRVLGLTHGQGYFFGGPLPLEEAFSLPQQWHPAPTSHRWDAP